MSLGLRPPGLATRLACGLLLAAGVAVATVPESGEARVVFSKRSLYRNLSVTDDGAQVCLHFAGVRNRDLAQSCVDKDDPQRLVFHYTRMTFAALLLQPHPKRILIAGLGGGTIPRAFHELFPDAKIDVVEIDPAVRDVARDYFGFREGPQVTVAVRDARVFVKHALLRRERYDVVVLDAFNGDYIPEHLMTLEFLEECRDLLAPGGVLVANTFSQSRLYDSESATYQKAFGWFLNLRRAGSNRIVLARKDGPRVSAKELQAIAAARMADPAEAQRLAAFGIDLEEVASYARERPDWDVRARVLTDQYSPANLLNRGGRRR